MKPARFDYHRPETLRDAVGLLAELSGDAKILAGGQSLTPLLNMRLARYGHLIDINAIEELKQLSVDNDTVRLGALVRHAEVADGRGCEGAPLLAKAARLVGHVAIRNRGTAVGSIVHADPAAELPAAAILLGATIEAVGPGGRRDIPASEFFVDFWETQLADDELVTGVRFPCDTTKAGTAVRELTRRHGDFAIAGAMCRVTERGGCIHEVAVAVFGMAPTPRRCAHAEAALHGQPIDRVDLRDIRIHADEVSPWSDLHASADYRLTVCERMAKDAIHEAIGELTR